MTTLREAAQQALEALEEIADEVFSPYDNKLGDAILALRAALSDQNRGWYTIDEINAKFDPDTRSHQTAPPPSAQGGTHD